MAVEYQAPADGSKITLADGALTVPDNPIIPYIEGDGIGVDITPVMHRVVDAAVAKAYGAPSWTVETTDAFGPAFKAALDHDGPALLHLKLDERDISPFAAEQAV